MRAVKTVLVVDDADYFRDLFSVILARLGLSVVTAGNGLEALDALQTHQPDLILTDLMMPIMDGYRLLENIRKDSRYEDVPVIVCSALAESRSDPDLLSRGANSVLLKPFTKADLEHSLRDCCGL